MSLYNIDTIIILIKSNIPDKQPFPFTKNSLYTAKLPLFSKYSEYPYITDTIKYPYKKLSKLAYDDIVNFFFIKQKFKYILENELNTNENELNKNQILEHNIITMIELLFSTYYPENNKISISFKDTISNEYIETHQTQLLDDNTSFYIKLDNEIYTISKVTWLNDVINNPLYGVFVDDFYNYQKWIQRTVPEIDNKIKTIQSDINRLIKKNDTTNEIKLLQKYLNEINIQSRYSDNSQRVFMINNMIQILNVIGIYKKYIESKLPERLNSFMDNYKKVLNEQNFLKNSWVEYKLPPPPPLSVFRSPESAVASTDHEWWYPVKINNDNGDGTYNIDVFKDEVSRATDKFSKEILENIPKENLRQLSFLQISDITENYQYVSTFRSAKLSYALFEPSAITGRVKLFEKIQVNFVDNKTGKANITYTDGSKKTEDVELFFLRSKVKTNDIEIDTKKPEEYLADSLYKLKESYEKNGYTNFSLNFKNYIKKLLEFNDSLTKINTIKQDYLNTDKDYLKFDSTFKVDEEFEQFTELSKTIKKLSSDTVKSTNTTLQELIDDYVNNSKNYEIETKTEKKHLFYELLQYIIKCYWLNNNCDTNNLINIYNEINTEDQTKINNFLEVLNNKTILKTNVNIINTKGNKNLPRYQIYIGLDLIKGKVDATNIGRFKCIYHDNKAADYLESNKKFKNKYLIEAGPFIDITNENINKKQEDKPIKTGGKTKKNKKRPKNKSKKHVR
jgi:hypothetical protein